MTTTLPAADAERDETRGQIRGSSLLLVGRTLSMVVNFGVQVLIVRYLSRSDFGAFAYAMSFVALAQTIATLGLDRSVARFAARYEATDDRGRLLGVLVLTVGTTLLLGTAMITMVVGLQGWLGDTLIADRTALSLLPIVVVLAPIEALDQISIGMFATFAAPRAIFVRRYVLAPGLRLVVVALLVATGSDATFLATGYVLAGAGGLLLYGVVLVRAMRARGVLGGMRWRDVQLPVKELFAFTIPMLTTDLVYIVMNLSDAILLGLYDGTEGVAAVRAITPAAKAVQLAMTSFGLLFLPAAARLLARADQRGLDHLYWTTASWLTVLTFPVFVLTFALAEPVTSTMFGERYASSAPYLALLSLGYFVQVSLGFNGMMLKVYGRLRYVVAINGVAALMNLGLNLLLIPRWGPLGAAIGTCVSLLVFNLLKHAGLRGTGLALFHPQTVRVYGQVAGATLAVVAVQQLLDPPFAIGLTAVALASLWLLWWARPLLAIGQTFPELRRVPVLGRLIG